MAGLALLVVYVALSFAMDTNGFLGTDTGGKVATVKLMSERGDFDPDVGYWAAQWDPDARVHGVITKGGEQANIIPEYTSAEFYLRGTTVAYCHELLRRFTAAAEGAAGP